MDGFLLDSSFMQEPLSDKTLGDILEYIKNHPKKTTVFHSWDDSSILNELIISAESQGLCWYEDDSGIIEGVIVMERDDEKKHLQIIGILSSSPNALPAFAQKYLLMFHGYSMAMRRKGKPTKYKNPISLCQKLSRHSLVSV